MIKETVVKAYNFSKDAHSGQKRKFSGLDYFTHPKYVARVVSQLTKDEELTIVALLHDVVEDTKTKIEAISDTFGESVANMVMELTIDKKDSTYKENKGLYLAEKMVEMTEGALTVKLADRFHNVLFLEEDNVDVNFKRRYWSETKMMMKVVSKLRKVNTVQKAIIDRILAVLKFLEIRYEW